MVSSVASYSPICLRVEASLATRLAWLSRGQPLVIDWFASRRCAVTFGDLTVGFRSVRSASDYAELEPIDDVRVFAERRLLDLLATGAEVKVGGSVFGHHLALAIDHPERWLEFLEHHPGNRR